jgi:hypothetical protein
VSEGVAARLCHPRVVKGRAAEYGVEVDGTRQDGDDGDLLQRRGRGAADNSGADVDMNKGRIFTHKCARYPE